VYTHEDGYEFNLITQGWQGGANPSVVTGEML
jgi:hypothetical protein